MSTGEALEKKKKTWLEVLEENKDQFGMALPKVGLTPERVIRTALTAMRQSKGGMLMKCDPKTVVASLLQSCELGLSVSNTLGHAYLVPFRNTQKGIVECTLIVGYRGFLALMKRSNEVSDVKSVIVYENEPFEQAAGDRPFLKHIPLPPDKRGAGIVGAYAVVLFRDGTSTFEFMWYDDIMKLKKRSKAKDSGPWVTDEEEMIKKCPIRRIAKRMPMSVDLQKAAVIDEYNEAGVKAGDMFVDDEPEQDLEGSVTPGSAEAEGKTKQEESGTEGHQPETNTGPDEKKTDSQEPVVLATEKQLGLIGTLFTKLGVKTADRHEIMGTQILGGKEAVQSMKDLTKEQASVAIKWLQGKVDESEGK